MTNLYAISIMDAYRSARYRWSFFHRAPAPTDDAGTRRAPPCECPLDDGRILPISEARKRQEQDDIAKFSLQIVQITGGRVPAPAAALTDGRSSRSFA